MPQTPVSQYFDQLPAVIYPNRSAMGAAAAQDARQIIQSAITQRGVATVILATGNSQLTFLHVLRTFTDIDW